MALYLDIGSETVEGEAWWLTVDLEVRYFDAVVADYVIWYVITVNFLDCKFWMLYDQYKFLLWTQHTCCVSVISFRLSEGQIDQLQHNISDSFYFLVCGLEFSSHVHKPVLCFTVCQPFIFSSHENVFLVTCISLMATFFALIFCQVHSEEQKFSTIQTSYGSEAIYVRHTWKLVTDLQS